MTPTERTAVVDLLALRFHHLNVDYPGYSSQDAFQELEEGIEVFDNPPSRVLHRVVVSDPDERARIIGAALARSTQIR